MPKQRTSPAPRTADPRPVPFLWTDIACLMDTHSVQPTSAGDHDDRNVRAVHRAIRRYLHHHDLPTDAGYAVPLYWLHQWLTSGGQVGPRSVNSAAAADAARTLVSALNAPDSGLEVVQQRRMQYSA